MSCTNHCWPSSSKQPSPSSSKHKSCSPGPQTIFLMFFKELKVHEQFSWSNLESHKDEILFHEHESSTIQKSHGHPFLLGKWISTNKARALDVRQTKWRRWCKETQWFVSPKFGFTTFITCESYSLLRKLIVTTRSSYLLLSTIWPCALVAHNRFCNKLATAHHKLGS